MSQILPIMVKNSFWEWFFSNSTYFSAGPFNSSWKSQFITQDSQKFKLCWKLYNVNIRLFCYYEFFILCHVAEIWPKTSNSAQKWELRKLRSDDQLQNAMGLEQSHAELAEIQSAKIKEF